MFKVGDKVLISDTGIYSNQGRNDDKTKIVGKIVQEKVSQNYDFGVRWSIQETIYYYNTYDIELYEKRYSKKPQFKELIYEE